MMSRSSVVIILAFLIASCTASLPYATDYPLSENVFRSRDGNFGGNVPRGWFDSSDDTLAPTLLMWLIREDFSAALTVQELRLDRLSLQRVEREGLPLLARISAGFHPADKSVIPSSLELKEFELGGNKFCSYELPVSEGRSRVVVFGAKGKYYECEAHTLKGRWTGDELVRMFTAQQSVLASLRY